MTLDYVGQRIALLTQHGKERAIAPLLESQLSCTVELAAGFDTDRLGNEIVDIAQGTGRSSYIQTDDWAALESFAHHAGFPEHLLVLRPQNQDDARLHKRK